MRVFYVALKDLIQLYSDRRVLIFSLAMPLVFTLFMGFAYQTGEAGEADAAASPSPSNTRHALGWVNQDTGGVLAEALHGLLADLDTVDLVALGGETVPADAVHTGDVAGVVLVPAGFSADARTSGRGPQVTLIADENTPAGQAVVQALRAPVTRLWSANEIARLAATDSEDSYVPALEAALGVWEGTEDTTRVRLEMAARPSDGAGDPWYGDNPYNQASPGILLQFAIMALVGSAQILLQERKSGTLQRLLSTSLSRWQIMAGHGLAMWIETLIQVAALVLFGQLVLGVDYLRAPLAVLAVSAGLGLWVAAMGLLVGGLAQGDSQVTLFSLMAMFIFTALGGAWFPLEASGGTFAAVGRLLPSAQAMTGYQNVLIRGLGLASVVTPVLALLGWALFFGLLASWRFRRIAG